MCRDKWLDFDWCSNYLNIVLKPSDVIDALSN